MSAAPVLLVSCAEPSGDRLAADVVARVRATHPTLRIVGVCGPLLRAQGVEPIAPMEDLAVMGVSAVLARAPSVLRARARLRNALAQGVSVALFVDAPALHLPLALAARQSGVSTIGYVCPQVWAWKPARMPAIGAAYAHLMCLFDFEPALLQATCSVHGSTVSHVGHPVVDRLPGAALRVPSPTPHFGFAPGSRKQELERHTTGYLQVADRLRNRLAGARITWAGARPPHAPAWLETTPHIEALQPCHAVLTKSGTVSLELAWMGVPQVVAHAVSPLTHVVGRALVRHVDHISLPNILLRTDAVPEFIGPIRPTPLTEALLQQMEQPPLSLPALGAPGAIDRAARVVLNALSPTHPQPDGGLQQSGRLPGRP